MVVLGEWMFLMSEVSAAVPRPHDPPPPCRRRHRLTEHGTPNAMGALRATLEGDAFEALGGIPETRRTSTTAERSAGCGVCSLRTVVGGNSDRGSENRQRRVAASSAPPRRATAMYCRSFRFFEHPT